MTSTAPSQNWRVKVGEHWVALTVHGSGALPHLFGAGERFRAVSTDDVGSRGVLSRSGWGDDSVNKGRDTISAQSDLDFINDS